MTLFDFPETPKRVCGVHRCKKGIVVSLKFNQMTATSLMAVVLLGTGPVACGQEDQKGGADPAPETAPAEAGSGLSDTDQLSYALGYVMAPQVAQAVEGGIDAKAFARGIAASQAEAPSAEDLSFAMGVMQGMRLKSDAQVTINTDLFAEAMMAALGGDPSRIGDQEMGLTLAMFQQKIQMLQQQRQAEQQAAQQAAQAVANEEADAYMAEAKTKEGMIATESGMLYKIVKMGDGPKPSRTDTVKVNYEGRFTDGEVFDSSYQRGEPTEFPLDRVVPGFSEGIALMPVGSEFELTLPPALNYGPSGPRPNSVMIFKVELLGIVTPESAPAPDGIAPPPAE